MPQLSVVAGSGLQHGELVLRQLAGAQLVELRLLGRAFGCVGNASELLQQLFVVGVHRAFSSSWVVRRARVVRSLVAAPLGGELVSERSACSSASAVRAACPSRLFH